MIEAEEEIHAAVLSGELGWIAWCRDNGADLVSRSRLGKTALETAREIGDRELIRVLEMTPWGPYQISPITLAIVGGHMKWVSYLLVHRKVKPDDRSSEGYAPMYLAALKKQYAIMWLLFEFGVPVEPDCRSIPGRENMIPFSDFFDRDHHKTLTILIAMGADVNATSTKGETIMHLAAHKARQDLFEMHLACRANPHARDHLGCTPLDRLKTNQYTWNCDNYSETMYNAIDAWPNWPPKRSVGSD